MPTIPVIAVATVENREAWFLARGMPKRMINAAMRMIAIINLKSVSMVVTVFDVVCSDVVALSGWLVIAVFSSPTVGVVRAFFGSA